MEIKKIENPRFLKQLNITELNQLSQDIRDFLIENISQTGGHFSSNLGIVELTVALHYVFDSPDDKILFDVGHQSYVHKILTGRALQFSKLKKYGGLCGFQNRQESIYDPWEAGHSSTAISGATGLALARELKKEKFEVVSVIGDAALMSGESLEALNFLGGIDTKVIVILNDNNMSISRNVGGLSNFLSDVRMSYKYNQAKNNYTEILSQSPMGQKIFDVTKKVKDKVKKKILLDTPFSQFDLDYIGPVDGHNIEELERMLNISKQLEGPVLIHVLTKKGKGYKIAEKSPDRFHATSPFNIETGELKKEKKADYSKIFGEKLVKLARENEKIVAVTASMKDGTGLREFQKEFPKRFFDVGIAEQHAITMSAGMAKEGMIPVIPIYSSFYQRAYDQVIHDVAMQNLPVIMCVDRAGCVGADGETHQGTLDMAFFRLVPNLTIMAPKDFKELEDMLEFAVKLNKPVIIRYPRGGEDSKVKFERHENIELGKAEVLKKIIDEEKSNKTKILQKIGNKVFNNKTQRERVTIIAIGKMVARAMDIGQRLQEKMDVEVINARFLKPLDDNTIIESIKKTKNVITIEDGTIINGLATAVKEVIVNNNLQGVKIKSYAYPDEFIKHGSVDELEKIYGLDEENIINGVNKS